MIFRPPMVRSLLCLAALCTLSVASAQETPPAAAPASPDSPAKPVRILRHLVIGESVEAVQQTSPAADSAFAVLSHGLASFDAAELNKRLATGGGRAIDERLLAAITQVVEAFFRQSEYPAATAVIPTQNIAEGVVRVIVFLGNRAQSLAASEWKIRKINVQGAKWFSESLLREKLKIEQGETVRYSELDQAIGWTNNNPFRRVAVRLDPVPNTGEADLSIAVQDAFPLRLSATVDNGGTELVGEKRYVAAVSYGNLWGKDHQVSYQYITTDRPEYYQAHGLDYRVPLSWRHYLQISGSYFHASPELYGGFFRQDGETITADLRYTVPLTIGNHSAEVYGAFSFKESNNNLTWDPQATNVQVLTSKTNVFQFSLGASTIRRDSRGAWAFAATATASPGNINSRNTDEAFDAGRFGRGDSARVGAKATYALLNVSIQRLQSLGHGWDFMSRIAAQVSEANLLPSEQFTIGGSASIRGYNENVFAGDHGFVFSSDLLAPAWQTPLPYLSKRRGPLGTRLLAFFDAGDTSMRRKFGSDSPRVALASTGVGVRMNLASNFSLNADYGWQLSRLPYAVEERSRLHLRASLSF